jgi:hypothetical protein
VKNKVIIRNEQNKLSAQDKLGRVVPDDKNPMVMTLEDYESQRTKEQNALIWTLATHFALHTTHFKFNLGKEGWYYAWSKAFLDPITTVNLSTGEIEFTARPMSNLGKKAFSDVLDKIYDYAREKNFPLLPPEEMKGYYDR